MFLKTTLIISYFLQLFTAARGIEQARKHVLMAALCYNLKKMLRFHSRKAQTQVSYAQITDKLYGLFDYLFFALA